MHTAHRPHQNRVYRPGEPPLSFVRVSASRVARPHRPAPRLCGRRQLRTPRRRPTAPRPSSVAASGSTTKPTVEEARAFVRQGRRRSAPSVDRPRSRVAWVNENFITDDTEFLAAQGEERTAEYVGRATHEAQRFAGMDLAGRTSPASSSFSVSRRRSPHRQIRKKRAELAGLEAGDDRDVRQGEVLPAAAERKVSHPRRPLEDAGHQPQVRRAARRVDRLARHLASPSRTSSRPTPPSATRAPRRSASPISAPPGAPVTTCRPRPSRPTSSAVGGGEAALRPAPVLRARPPAQTYGKDKVPDHGPIPAHLLGNMWAQEWNNIYDLVEPYKGQPSLDVSKKLKAKKLRPGQDGEAGRALLHLARLRSAAEDVLGALALQPARRIARWSATPAPGTRSTNDDLRIKVCVQPTEEDLITDPPRARSRLLLPVVLPPARSSSSRAPTTVSTRASATPSRSASRLPT